MSLDKWDRRIIAALSRDARLSAARLGKTLERSRQFVNRRLNRLREDGVITKALLIPDVAGLGLGIHKMYVQLSATTLAEEEAIIGRLAALPAVAWLVRCDGAYDLAFAVHTAGVQDLARVLASAEAILGGHAAEQAVSQVVTGAFLPRAYLQERDSMEKALFATSNSKAVLDGTDRAILSALCEDARRPASSIRLGLTPDAINKRIRQLEHSGIITGSTVILDVNRYGWLHVKVLVKLSARQMHHADQVFSFCESHPSIVFYNHVVGAWDVEIDIEVEDLAATREVMRQLKETLGASIERYASLNIYRIEKFRLYDERMGTS